MPCPDCRARGVGGGARIGNQRTDCRRCNRFAQRVMRETSSTLKQWHPGDYDRIRESVERRVYEEMMSA